MYAIKKADEYDMQVTKVDSVLQREMYSIKTVSHTIDVLAIKIDFLIALCGMAIRR